MGTNGAKIASIISPKNEANNTSISQFYVNGNNKSSINSCDSTVSLTGYHDCQETMFATDQAKSDDPNSATTHTPCGSCSQCSLAADTSSDFFSDLRRNMVCKRTGKLYVFGYGSLIWKPNFPFSRSWVGYVQGYQRRFFQATTTHRGTPERPGRVATLIASNTAYSRVWGVAFEVSQAEHIDLALKHLAEREMITGGYRFDQVEFHSYKQRSEAHDPHACPPDPLIQDVPSDRRSDRRSFIVQVYIATMGNPQYFGDAPIEIQAYQIATSKGHCGYNSEYLFKVCHFMKTEVPPDEAAREDAYLLMLESLVQQFIEGNRKPPSKIPLSPFLNPPSSENSNFNFTASRDAIVQCKLPSPSEDLELETNLSYPL